MSLEIDRLVLDLPNLRPEQARALAERIAIALSQGVTGGSADRIVVTVPADASPHALAAAVAAQARGRLR